MRAQGLLFAFLFEHSNDKQESCAFHAKRMLPSFSGFMDKAYRFNRKVGLSIKPDEALSISPEIREGVGERGDVLSGAGLMALS